MKLIFLDIDGVLCPLSWNWSGEAYQWKPECCQHLTEIINQTGARLAISSSWRDMFHDGHFSHQGFEILLRTHGIPAGSLAGFLRPSLYEDEPRSLIISEWLKTHPSDSYVILDDSPLGGVLAQRLVLCTPDTGLSRANLLEAVKILNRS